MNEKNPFIDFLKGIAIILVLVGHCIQYGSGATYLNNGLYWENAVMKTIYSFHMPLFMAISGYLFCFSVKKHKFLNAAQSRIFKFLPVCCAWAVIAYAVDFVSGKTPNIKHLIYYFLTNFWFLWAILFSITCVAVTEFADKCTWGGDVACLILVLMFMFTPDILSVHTYKFVAPYFIGGYYYAKRQHNWQKEDKVGVVSAILWGLLMLLYSKDTYIYTTGITVFHKTNIWKQVVVDCYRYLVGAAGVITVIWISKKAYALIEQHKAVRTNSGKRLIAYMGRNSIIYYILSNYLFLWILPEITKNFPFNLLLTLTETVIVALLCDAVGRLLKHSKAISRWLIAS